MHVRFAAHDDIPALVRLRFDFFATAPHLIVTGEEKAQMAATLESYYERHLNRDFFAALAVIDEKIAAVSFLGIYEKPANYRYPTGKTAQIHNVFTYIEYRFNGYATATLKLLIDKAREENVSLIELAATKDGKPVYEKLGFEEAHSTHSTEMVLRLI
jgi:predicted acetyltransferase